MKATVGTNTLIWGNLLGAIGSLLLEVLNPGLITGLLGAKYGFLAPVVLAIVNWLGHGLTGNSATSVLPGVMAPGAPSPNLG